MIAETMTSVFGAGNGMTKLGERYKINAGSFDFCNRKGLSWGSVLEFGTSFK